jgi:hypothetical protein
MILCFDRCYFNLQLKKNKEWVHYWKSAFLAAAAKELTNGFFLCRIVNNSKTHVH